MSSDWALRELLRLLLEDRDYSVLEASDAAEVFDVVEETDDALVVVLDLVPEDTTALDVLRAAARDSTQCFRHAYVILAPPEQPLPYDIWPLIEALAIPVLCKPLDLDELFEVVGVLSLCLRGTPSRADSLRL
jgi:CheY-like chemotaxis protein